MTAARSTSSTCTRTSPVEWQFVVLFSCSHCPIRVVDLCVCFKTYCSQAWDSLLILHDLIDGNGHVRRCEFLTRGFVSDPHGSWTLRGDSLVVHFNYQFDICGQHHNKTLPLHPTTLDRMPNDSFEGWDDKHCQITMEHARSLIKAGKYWQPTAPL